jgi:hypothetical protein
MRQIHFQVVKGNKLSIRLLQNIGLNVPIEIQFFLIKYMLCQITIYQVLRVKTQIWWSITNPKKEGKSKPTSIDHNKYQFQQMHF